MNTVQTTLLLVFKWVVTTTNLLLVLGVCIIATSVLLSAYTGHWHWFQRSGALLVSIGAILSTRKLLRIGVDGLLLGRTYSDVAEPDLANVYSDRQIQDKCDLTAAYWGFWVVGFGTIVWAYGDLIACLIEQNMDCMC